MTKARELALPGVLEIVPERFGDARGFFAETYNKARFTGIGIPYEFVQDNHSLSAAPATLRGLHYQLPPHAQAKLVRVVRGAILDVAADIRRASPTFRRWVALEVSADKGNQIYVPAGFAHGFVTLAPDTEVVYKVTDFHAPASERAIRFDDPELAIRWPFAAAAMQLSTKDRAAPFIAQAEVFD